MSLEYLFSPTKQFTYPSGKLLDGGKIFVYFKDTTDLVTLYSPDGSFVSNPILLDANGRASVRADIAYQYRLEIYTNDNVLLYTCEAFCEGDGSGGFSFVIHDETLSGNGTASSPLGVINIPLAVEDSLTAYEDIVEGKNALVLGVNSAWMDNRFIKGLSSKVDWSVFSACCDEVKDALSSKLDSSAYDLSNYYNKQETTYLLSNYYNKQEIDETVNVINELKQDKLTFEYNDSSAISSINGSALAGSEGGDNCPWISGTKVIADTQTLTSNMIIQVLSSFTMSGDHNHFIGMKGGTYRFPNEYEIGSALLHTNYFMHLSGMSGYLPISSFSGYTASIANNLENNWNYTNSAYSLSINNFYNKLDASAFSSYSAGQDTIINNITNQINNISGSYATKTYVDSKDPVLIGDSNVTATSSKVDNHTQWNLAVNGTPVVTDTTLVGDNCVTAHTTQTSGEWIVGLVQSAYEAIDSIDGISSDVDTLKNASGNYYPMTGNPSGFINDLSNYYQKNETSSKEQISDAIASIPQGDPDVNNFVQTNSSTIVNVDNVVQVNSAQWAENTGDTQVNNYVYNNSGINNEVNNVVTANSGVWNNVTNKLDTTAFTAWSSTIFSGDYELSAGDGIALVDDNVNKITRIDFTGTSGPDLSAGEGIDISTIDGKTIITNNISAGQGISLVYDVESNKIRIDGEGKEYSGVAPIIVDNTNKQISITGESLSAGPGIDIFSSGGYVVISANGGNSFPITGSNGTTAYTANMDCSSVFLTTASSPAGGYVKQTVQGVQYEAYPATDVSASWYNIINGANNRSNCYCIRFTNDMTAASLEDYSAYDKVTVVHSNQYTPDCMLYWDGNTKVFPSGLYCELVKGTNDRNQTDWFFTNSGWINNLEWDWD